MIASRIKLFALVLILSLLGGGVAAYKHAQYGIPLTVDEKPAEWLVEAKISFIALNDPVNVRLALPDIAADREMGFDARSMGYHFMVEDEIDQHVAIWNADQRNGPQSLYYRVRFPERGIESGGPIPHRGDAPDIREPGLPQTQLDAAQSVIRRITELSTDPTSIFVGIFDELAASQPSQETALLKSYYEELYGQRAHIMLGIDLLKLSGIAAQVAYGLELNESRGSQDPQLFIEYFDGVYWHVRNPEKPSALLNPRSVFIWNRGGDPLLDVSGGENSKIVFTAVRDMIPTERLTDLLDSNLLIATIFGLPASERQVFRYVVLIPIGAFVVVILRNIIGIATLGTFMPVLLALSFLEMELSSGLVMFVGILAVGLWFRFLLSRLNLLVVPRVAACVVIVTLLMMLLSVVSWHFGLRDGLNITLFPMIILAWTIERMSLIWEEEGKRNALIQITGSIIVAVVAYKIMEVRQIRYLAFYFPELMLILLAGIILIGRYTGYRLSELFRFKHFQEVQ